MLVSATTVRPAYRPYVATVVGVRRLSPSFVRVTFTGPEVEHFGAAGGDQRIKVLLPHPDGSFSDIGQDDGAGDWYDRWRALPTAARNPFRTYTVRGLRPERAELDVDFVVHHDAGPAGTWAAQAAMGQRLVVVGPDRRSTLPAGGVDFHPGTATRILLVGDETAAPAIAGILESLDDAHDVDVFVEVPTAEDALTIDAPASARVTWLARGDRAHGDALREAVTAWTDASGALLARAAAPRPQEVADIDVDRELLWESPDDAEGEFYAWMAGEAATIKALRRLLVSERGVDRRRVAFMGYWRAGQAERTE
ncbi:siderophore-interacting protein [Microbacterium sp. GXF7504]